MAPAWMAELSEEWVEPVEDAERVENDDGEQSNDLDFGSLVINDMQLPSPSQASIDEGNRGPLQFGTTVFHDAPREGGLGDEEERSYQMGSILFSPSKKYTPSYTNPASNPSSPDAAPSPGQQLAMAAAAFNKDLLHQAEDSCIEDESNPPTSIHIKATPAKQLQSLFMQPPSPALSPTPISPEAQNRSSNEEEEQQDQATRYEEYRDTFEGTSYIVNQHLEVIPDPSLPEESLQPGMRDVDNDNLDAKENSARESSLNPTCIYDQAGLTCIAFSRRCRRASDYQRDFSSRAIERGCFRNLHH